MEWVTWTYYFRRILKNPVYYGLKSTDTKDVKSFLVKLIEENTRELLRLGCII